MATPMDLGPNPRCLPSTCSKILEKKTLSEPGVHTFYTVGAFRKFQDGILAWDDMHSEPQVSVGMCADMWV